MVERASPVPEEILRREYPYRVIAAEEGGYVVEFPDLPGCLTQAETPEEVGVMADDAKRAWLETAYLDGREIPQPTIEDSFSGRFVVRMPRSLHRALAEQAEREGVSLNQYIVALLARDWPSRRPVAEARAG
jgi:antitoxin HicB